MHTPACNPLKGGLGPWQPGVGRERRLEVGDRAGPVARNALAELADARIPRAAPAAAPAPVGIGVQQQPSRPAQRARQVSGGADLTIERDRDKNPVVALREIAEQSVKPRDLEEAVIANLQKVRIDEEDETDELASLSESAEAPRLTAAAPPRPSPSGGDYE